MRRGNMRSGFTMIELIFVIVVLAILAIGSYLYLSGTYSRTKVTASLNTDIKALTTGAVNYKTSSPNSNNSFANMDNAEVFKYITTDNYQLNGDGTIRGLQLAGCSYSVAPFATDQQYKILVDCSGQKTIEGWDNRKTQVFEEKVAKMIQDRSSTPTTIDYTATAIGNANAALTAGGTTTDGIVGVTGIGG